jgi:uncharacterized membrane protein
MTENPGGPPPRDDEPRPDGPVTPPAPEAAGQPAPPVPPPYGSAPYGAPSEAPPGYGPPPVAPAGYPPPPPAGYGPPPGAPVGYPTAPPPPPGAYAAPPSPIGDSFKYGWTAFTRNGGLFIAASLIWLVIGAIATAVVWAVVVGVAGGTDEALGYDEGRAQIGFSFGILVISAALALVATLIQAAFIRASLKVTNGSRVELSDFFRFENAGNVVLAALLIAGINAALGLVSWIPLIGWLVSVAVNLLIFFTLWFVVDKNLNPVDAISSSVALVRANLSTTILFYLLALVVIGAGFALCFVGALVAIPVVLVATAYLYRYLLGEQIAPVK